MVCALDSTHSPAGIYSRVLCDLTKYYIQLQPQLSIYFVSFRIAYYNTHTFISYFVVLSIIERQALECISHVCWKNQRVMCGLFNWILIEIVCSQLFLWIIKTFNENKILNSLRVKWAPRNVFIYIIWKFKWDNK